MFRKIGRRKLVPYYDRAEIEDGAIAGRGLEICWLKNQTDLLFAQIQGSARVRLEDGSTIRINYDAHNGYPYTAVGRILIDRGIIPKEQMSMQKIREWMDQNPDGAKELRRQNRSYVFFREVQLSDKDEAVGAQGVPLTPGRSIAVDKSLHVYGTPFFIEGELPIESEQSKTPFRRLMIAQDTGSAITGPARADLYFGAGADAGQGVRPASAQYAFRHAGAEEPRSGGARPQDAAAGSEAVGENRKAVSANRSVEGSAKGPARSRRTPRASRRSRGRAAQRSRRHRRAGSPQPLPQSRCRCRKPRPNIEPSREAASPPSSPLSPQPMKRPPSTSIPELPAPPRRKRSAQRRRARAVGERRQADKAAAEKAARRQAAGGFIGRGNAGRCETRGSAKAASASQNAARAKAGRHRRWRRSDAASARNCRAAGRRSMPGSICTA